MGFKIYFCPVIISVISVMRILGFIEPIDELYPVAMICAFIYLLYNGIHKLYYPLLIVLFICMLSILFNNPDPVFRAWERLAYFCLVLGVVSPLFQSNRMFLFRVYLFKCTMVLLVISSVISFVCYFLGVNFMRRDGDVLIINSGTFSGILYHSMELGPVAALSCCYLSTYLFCPSLSNRKKIILIIFLLASFGALLLSASRGAFLGGLVGLLFILYKLNKKHLMKFVKYLLVAICLLLPIWNISSDMLLQKQKGNLESGSMFMSRYGKWESRMIEFKSNPILGVGFSSVNVRGYDYYDRKTGMIEPGTSWGGVLSMIGIFGFLLLVYIVYSNWSFLLKDINNELSSAYLGGCLSFFIVHLIVEGYIFGAGSFLCYMFWLLLGVLAVNKKYNINLFI